MGKDFWLMWFLFLAFIAFAAGMTAFGILVFHYGLGVQLPVIRGF